MTEDTPRSRPFHMLLRMTARNQRLFCSMLIVIIVVFTLFVLHGHKINISIMADNQKDTSVRSGVVYQENTSPTSKPMGLPDCGEVCSYGGSSVPDENSSMARIRKNMNCKNILGRMAYRNQPVMNPPPKQPPSELREQYTQMGYMAMAKDNYINEITGDRVGRTYSAKTIESFAESFKAGNKISSYEDGSCMGNTLKSLNASIKDSLQSLVIGTQRPWVEAMLLALGSQHITTLEYASVKLLHPKMKVYSPYAYAEMFIKEEVPAFDFAATYSSLEHAGLGRYGDPLNPYGDMEAMAQTWCMLKSGGIFVVGLPGSRKADGNIYWNAHRVYGFKRLEQMAANWDLLKYEPCPGSFHILLVLRKP